LVTVTGVFLPARYQGYRAIRAGLIADTFLEVNNTYAHTHTHTRKHIY